MPVPQVWQPRGRRPQSPKPSRVSGYPETRPGVLAHLLLDDRRKMVKCWNRERGLWPRLAKPVALPVPLLVHTTPALSSDDRPL